MTKKDYVAIARVFNGYRAVAAPICCSDEHEYMRGANDQAHGYAHALCDIFAADNPHFNRAKFLDACGIN